MEKGSPRKKLRQPTACPRFGKPPLKFKSVVFTVFLAPGCGFFTITSIAMAKNADLLRDLEGEMKKFQKIEAGKFF